MEMIFFMRRSLNGKITSYNQALSFQALAVVSQFRMRVRQTEPAGYSNAPIDTVGNLIDISGSNG